MYLIVWMNLADFLFYLWLHLIQHSIVWSELNRLIPPLQCLPVPTANTYTENTPVNDYLKYQTCITNTVCLNTHIVQMHIQEHKHCCTHLVNHFIIILHTCNQTVIKGQMSSMQNLFSKVDSYAKWNLNYYTTPTLNEKSKLIASEWSYLYKMHNKYLLGWMKSKFTLIQ